MRPIKKWQKLAGEYTAVVGIAADEEKRIHRKAEKDNFLPLVEYGIVEADAFKICKEGGVPLSSIQRRTRTAGLLVLPQSKDSQL